VSNCPKGCSVHPRATKECHWNIDDAEKKEIPVKATPFLDLVHQDEFRDTRFHEQEYVEKDRRNDGYKRNLNTNTVLSILVIKMYIVFRG
jgi:hypothetical protein